jgi:hypothetical protein
MNIADGHFPMASGGVEPALSECDRNIDGAHGVEV